MQLIKDWHKKDLTCCKCGTDKSVKYYDEDEDKVYCNSCISKQYIKQSNINKAYDILNKLIGTDTNLENYKFQNSSDTIFISVVDDDIHVRFRDILN